MNTTIPSFSIFMVNIGYMLMISIIYPFYPHFIPIFFDGEIPQFWPTAKVKTRLRGAAAWWAWAPRMGGFPRYGSHNPHKHSHPEVEYGTVIFLK